MSTGHDDEIVYSVHGIGRMANWNTADRKWQYTLIAVRLALEDT